MQSSVTSLGTKASAFKASRATAATSQAKADADAATADTDRRAVDAELLSYVSLALATAKTPADLTGSGVNERPPPPAQPPFAPPDQIDILFPKQVKGKFKTSPHGFANRKLTWVVQMTSDPAGTGGWTDVYGSGNTRTITGASGSKVWVRYAMLRRGQQSAWSTPVLVTIP
jgi:hypothetical protein